MTTKTHVCGKGVGFHKDVKLAAAQAMIDLLNGKESILTYNDDNREKQKTRDKYIRALSQSRPGKRSALCKVIMQAPGLPDNLRSKNPKHMVRKYQLHTQQRKTVPVTLPVLEEIRFEAAVRLLRAYLQHGQQVSSSYSAGQQTEDAMAELYTFLLQQPVHVDSLRPWNPPHDLSFH